MIYSDFQLEKILWDRGYFFVAGIDEAGRGPWAGPVVSGAVCFEKGFEQDLKLRDSKKIKEKNRELLYAEIIKSAKTWGVGIVAASEIDKLGISEAVRKSMEKALYEAEKRFGSKFDFLIIDGTNVKEIPGYEQSRINKADTLHCSVSAAAILAKVTRDRIMNEYAVKYPVYGFEKNKAYGTKEHQEALIKYGPSPIHRFSYKPIKEINEKFKVRSDR